jgi:hypothetical protein
MHPATERRGFLNHEGNREVYSQVSELLTFLNLRMQDAIN